MTIHLEILGTGCPKCTLLAEHTERAARELGLDVELVKVTAVADIIARGVMSTPALVVDGEIVVEGHVPSTPRLREILAAAAAPVAG